jgi:broad specificity phosphatase PhoE
MSVDKIEVLKTVRLVRHGQSEHNIAPIYQAEDVSLSEAGREQARLVACRLWKDHQDFSVLMSSPHRRAQQTASFISDIFGFPIVTEHLVIERLKPLSVEGKPYTDPVARETWTKWHNNFYSYGDRVEDGETYLDLINRVHSSLELFKNCSHRDILVVSHGLFIRSIVLTILTGPYLNAATFKPALFGLKMENTGITTLHYQSYNGGTPAWAVDSHNDYTHLLK